MAKYTSNKQPILLDLKAGTYFWCACGKSSTPPFCDGSHQGSPHLPVKKIITSDSKVAWCNCKLTHEAPFCDGSHKYYKKETKNTEEEDKDWIF